MARVLLAFLALFAAAQSFGADVSNDTVISTGGSAARSLADREAHWFFVEDYRLATDPSGDDTGPIQRACTAAMSVLGEVHFEAKQYNVKTLTVGVEGQREVCNFIGAGWNGDVGRSTTGGTHLRLISGTNDSMIVVPSTAPPFTIENIYLDGNGTNQTGTSYGIDLVDYTTDSNRARAVLARNVWIQGFLTAGIYAGLLRNAGVLDHVTVLGGSTAAIVLASNNDWRFANVDAGSSLTGPALYLTGGGTFTSVASNYFSSKNGVRIDASALDAQFIGGSIDTNTEDGVVLLGSTPESDTSAMMRVFSAVWLRGNGYSAANTFSDFKLVGEKHAMLTGVQFLASTPSHTGGNLPKYHINVDANSSNVRIVGTSYQDTPPLSYATAFSNDPQKLIAADIPFNLKYGVNGPTNGAPLELGTSGDTFNGICAVPAAIGARAAITACGAEPTRGLVVQSPSSASVLVGNATDGNSLVVSDCGGPCANQASVKGGVAGSATVFGNIGTDTNGAGLSTTLSARSASAAGDGGSVLTSAGNASGANNGGANSMNAGTGNAVGNGGDANVVAGRGGTTSGNGGNVNLTPGAVTSGTPGTINLNGSLKVANILATRTSPAVQSGFGSSPSITANGSSSFAVTVGSGGTQGVIVFPSRSGTSNGWACSAADVTNPASSFTQQTGSTANTATFTNFVRTTGAAGAWTAGDVIEILCLGN